MTSLDSCVSPISVTPLLFGSRRHDSARTLPSPSERQSNTGSTRHRSHSLSESLSERALQALQTASEELEEDELNNSRSATAAPAHRRSTSASAIGSGSKQRRTSMNRKESPNPRSSPFSPRTATASLQRPSTPRSAQVSRASLSNASTARSTVVPASDSKLSRRVKLKRSFSEVDTSIIPQSPDNSAGTPRRAVSSLVFTSPILQAPPLCVTSHRTFPVLPLQQFPSTTVSPQSCSLHRIEAGFLHSTSACPERARGQVKKIVDWMNSELGGLPPSPIPIRQLSEGATGHAVPLSPSSKSASFQPILRPAETLYVLVNTDANSTAGKRCEVIAACIVIGIEKAWEMIERKSSCGFATDIADIRSKREPEAVTASSQDFTQPMDEEDREEEQTTSLFKSPVSVIALSSPTTAAADSSQPARKKLKATLPVPLPQRSVSTPVVSDTNTSLLTSSSSAITLFESAGTSRRYFPASIGVEKILVARRYRRAGWASTLLDALRHDILKWNCVVPVSHVAFSEPLELGCRFASAYCKTTQFLTY